MHPTPVSLVNDIMLITCVVTALLLAWDLWRHRGQSRAQRRGER